MWEIKETSPSNELHHGHTVVGLTAVRIVPVSVKLVRGLMLRAPGPSDSVPNTDIIYIGRQIVTADANTGSGGMPLLPGSSIVLPVDDGYEIYAISASANQDVAWIGV